MARGLSAQRELGAIDAENTRITARRAARSGHLQSWYEAQFHQTMRNIGRQVQRVQHGPLALGQLQQAAAAILFRLALALPVIDTQLQHNFRITLSETAVKRPPDDG